MNNDSHTFFTTFIFKFFLTLFYLIVKINFFFFFQFSIPNYCIRCNTLSSSLDLDKLGSMVVFFFWSKR